MGKFRKFQSREWAFIGAGVWEHRSGLRINSRMARMPDNQTWHSLSTIDAACQIDKLLKIWGSRRRATLAFGLELLGEVPDRD